MAKIKNKTKSAAKKRFKITATGKILRKRSHIGHNSGTKTNTHMRRLTRITEVSEVQKKNVERCRGLR